MVENTTMELQLGQLIRPQVDCDKAIQLVETLYGFKVLEVRQLDGYDDRNFHVQVSSENYTNPHVEQIWPHGYVLKVMNSIDSLTQHADGEHTMMRTLHTNNITCPLPVLNIHGSEKAMEKLGNDDVFYLVRLLTYIPGERVETVPYTSQLMHQLGVTLASVHDALQNLNHPALSARPKIWSLSSVPRLRQFTYAIDDDDNRQLVLDVFDAFERQILPDIALFTSGVLHGDFNEQNVLVCQSPQSSAITVVGVIDFGDSERGPYVFDLAIAIMYCMLQCRVVDPFDACSHFLAGYLSCGQRALAGSERVVLWLCVAARFAQSLTMGAYTYSVDPSNSHVLKTAKRGWQLLRQMWKETSGEELETRLDTVLASCGYDS